MRISSDRRDRRERRRLPLCLCVATATLVVRVLGRTSDAAATATSSTTTLRGHNASVPPPPPSSSSSRRRRPRSDDDHLAVSSLLADDDRGRIATTTTTTSSFLLLLPRRWGGGYGYGEVSSVPCCFSRPPSSSSSSVVVGGRDPRRHHRSRHNNAPCRAMPPSSTVVASLFLRNVWKRTLLGTNMPRGGSMTPVKDAPLLSPLSTPSYLDTLSSSSTTTLERNDEVTQASSSSLMLVGGDEGSGLVPDGAVEDASCVRDDADLESQFATTNNDDDDDDDDDDDSDPVQEKKFSIHTYRHDPATSAAIAAATGTTNSDAIVNSQSNNADLTLLGLGMPRRQFASWVRYHLTHTAMDGEVLPPTTTDRDGPNGSAPESSPAESSSILIRRAIERGITTEEAEWEHNAEWETRIAPMVQEAWREGRLVCEHTNLVSGPPPPRDDDDDDDDNGTGGGSKDDAREEGAASDGKNGGERREVERFRDALRSYADRMASIVEDEGSDKRDDDRDEAGPQQTDFGQVVGLPAREVTATHRTDRAAREKTSKATSPKWTTRNGLLGWIESEYGVENTRRLSADSLLKRSEEEQLETFQSFLDWFRSEFPYYHDKCDSCGASCNDDPIPRPGDAAARVDEDREPTDGSAETSGDADRPDEEHDDNFSFLGYVRPTPSERLGNASRTELYRCRSCSSFTRFPRYNRALWVTSSKRGRCGEYSVLLYRMLRVLGYDRVRWVVDWADHVWAEVRLGGGGGDEGGERDGGRWVHLDPCEAAVDEPLLYETWGKNQTYIVAFHDPFHRSNPGARDDAADTVSGSAVGLLGSAPSLTGRTSVGPNDDARGLEGAICMGDRHRFPPVEDVTHRYTSDERHVVDERRGAAGAPVAEAIAEVSRDMVTLLRQITRRS